MTEDTRGTGEGRRLLVNQSKRASMFPPASRPKNLKAADKHTFTHSAWSLESYFDIETSYIVVIERSDTR